ncbi:MULTISPECIES: pentapeptide repeat-containing protein [unclassified Pedobacter]|uniref:pentapeptide repeat-containing protein n=1 Tax=unclassified Pedobacter TaxID=2628915 RepID=UPI001DC52219|nr:MULTISPECIES: pentapeptide repeat-containing protein [unclassified Pedobacter]CAH0135928.1 Secreted effector protein PipB2 [Pedobacter sp. Bi36]CAH0191495.1 Secreted effector protein PipB2 [Pedobacter sp. Bi126]
MDAKMIGNKIAGARKKINMSQAGLAGHVFVSPQAVGKWERGESMPDIITLNQLTKILDVDLNYFSENHSSANAISAVEETIPEVSSLTDLHQPQLLTNFSGNDLAKTDFAGVIAHKLKFNGSNLRGSDFTGADLTGSSFLGSDAREANFQAANLTDCSLSATDLTATNFDQAILVRTKFYALELAGAKISNTKLIEVKLSKTDLRKTVFENCVFEGVDFDYSDLRGLRLDGQTFIGVLFHNAALNETTFKGATLKNVSFRSTFALTNKYYKAIKTICFEGATMDKLTYASLKGLGADLSKVNLM